MIIYYGYLLLMGVEIVMNPYIIRRELKRMKGEDLCELAGQQKKRWCDIGASECPFFVEYKGRDGVKQ